MARPKKTNNELINQKNNNENVQVVRKRGRPKGTKNSIKTTRQDKQPITEQGENTKVISYSLALSNLPKIDPNNIEQVKQRINDFMSISALHDMKLSIAALAVAFGIDRVTLFRWMNEQSGTIKNQECRNTIKSVYSSINLQYEYFMNAGKINPVAGIFLMKNNFGYKDTTDHIITASNNTDPSNKEITDKAGLLD